MKKLVVLSLFISTISFGQFFESEDQQQDEEQAHIFSTEQENNGPDQGVDGPGDPGEPPLPIDKWIYILPFAGMVVGFYFLDRKRKLT